MNKNMSLARFTALCRALPILLSIAACGASGPGGPGFCTTDDPSVTSLALAPDSAVVGEGAGSIDIEVAFDYRTRQGAKLGLLTYRLVDANGARVVNEVVDVFDLNLKGSGTFNFSFPAPTQTAQIYRFRVRVTDECLSESEWAETNFSVVEPAGLQGKTDFGIARLNGFIYVIGGRDASDNASGTLLRHDPKTGTTMVGASLPEERFTAAVTTYTDLIFVFGGRAFGHLQDSTFIYDPGKDSWTLGAPMSQATAGANAFVIDEIIYVATNGHVDRYQPVTDIWQ